MKILIKHLKIGNINSAELYATVIMRSNRHVVISEDSDLTHKKSRKLKKPYRSILSIPLKQNVYEKSMRKMLVIGTFDRKREAFKAKGQDL